MSGQAAAGKSAHCSSDHKSGRPGEACWGVLPSSPIKCGRLISEAPPPPNHPNSPGLSSCHNFELMEKDCSSLLP